MRHSEMVFLFQHEGELVSKENKLTDAAQEKEEGSADSGERHFCPPSHGPRLIVFGFF